MASRKTDTGEGTSRKSSTSSTPMSQETAQFLFHEGATLILLDVPKGTEFGIDYNSWTVGPKFRGMKMIPPGVHFVYYSVNSSFNQQGPRTGFFYNFKSKEIVVKKWDKQLEDISPEIVSSEEVERLSSNKRELDEFLGPYPYDSYRKWVSLTNHLPHSLVSRLQPSCGKICSVTELVSEASTSQSRKHAAEAQAAMNGNPSTSTNLESQIPDLKRAEGSEFNFTTIPKQKYPQGATPSEVTKYNLDHSYVLTVVLESAYKDNVLELLGEIQFAFICFLIGQVYEAFDQWKHLVHLLCFCDEALGQHKELFSQFMSIIHYHLKEIPEDFFVDIVSQNNFLTTTLQVFFSNIDSNDCVDPTFKDRARKFRESLQKTFKWDFTLDPDDDAPVVVELGS